MTEAPERMTLQPCPMYGWEHPDRVKYVGDYGREYILADLHAAQVARLQATNAEALEACQIIDAAVKEGHDNVRDLIMHLLSAAGPARAALRANVTEIGDMPETFVGDIGNYYGRLAIKCEDGKPLWSIENYDGMRWVDCPAPVFAALRALAEARP